MRAKYFYSGSNHPGEILGLSSVNANVGVAAHELKKGSVEELEKLADTESDVFIDSGAFSEVAVNLWIRNEITSGKRKGELRRPELPRDARWLPRPDLPVGVIYTREPITGDEWKRRIAIYFRLAAKLGRKLWAVAPDKVADQKETLARLRRYAWEMRELRRFGVNIIVPIQKGRLSMAAFDRAATKALGFDDYVRGVPLKKDATSLDELRRFAASLPKGTGIHLLGKGPHSDDFADCLAACRGLVVTCDSVRIRALVGRGEEGENPRALTLARDEIIEELGIVGRLSSKQVREVKAEAIRRVIGNELSELSKAA